jgi:hypothetical protein
MLRLTFVAWAAATVMAGSMLPSSAGADRPGAVRAIVFQAAAKNSHHVLLDWKQLPPGAITLQVFRDGLLIDRFPVRSSATYHDRLLWPSTTFGYAIEALDASSNVIGQAAASVTTPAQTGSFPRLYASTSFWNTKIGKDPVVDPASAQIVAKSITPYAGVSVLNINNHWGIPIAYADHLSHKYLVGCTNPGCDPNVTFRIPRYALANFGGDAKLTVIDPTTNLELDMGHAVYDGATDTWTTTNRFVTASDGWGAMCAPGQHCSGILMSGIVQFGGVTRPEEIAQGHIDHAVALSIPYWSSDYFVCPAVKNGGGYHDPLALPLGAQLQLDPTFDVAAQHWPTYEKVIAVALQRYGGFVVDGGSTALEVRGETSLDRGYDPWTKIGIPDGWPGGPTLNDVPWALLRVLKLQPC